MKALRMLVLVLLAAALCAFAAPPETDCPPGSPDCPLEPPQTVEINPQPRTTDGELAPVEEPGALTPVQAVIPMPPPTYVDVVPLPERAPFFETLDVGMRYQGEGDASCGVQALGMALEGLGAPAPTSSSLLDFLQQNGMFYDFGTGVEELAYAAQAHGYGGAYAFHNWDMGMLADELAAGHPVVAALGANGEGQPGHFVTVTGISPDGQWVAYNDPMLGEQRMPTDEFAALWALQGNSGARVALEAPVTSSGEMDPFPWVALAAGVMALVTQFPWGQRREGIGGALAKDVNGEDVVRVVPRTTVKKTVPDKAGPNRIKQAGAARRPAADGSIEPGPIPIAPCIIPLATGTPPPPEAETMLEQSSHPYSSSDAGSASSGILIPIEVETPSPPSIEGATPSDDGDRRIPVCATPMPGSECTLTGFSGPPLKVVCDLSKLDWIDAVVDIAGIVGDIARGVSPGAGQIVWLGSELGELLTLGRSWDELELGDPTGVLTDILADMLIPAAQAQRLIPGEGVVGNIVGLGFNYLGTCGLEVDSELLEMLDYGDNQD